MVNFFLSVASKSNSWLEIIFNVDKYLCSFAVAVVVGFFVVFNREFLYRIEDRDSCDGSGSFHAHYKWRSILNCGAQLEIEIQQTNLCGSFSSINFTYFEKFNIHRYKEKEMAISQYNFDPRSSVY